MLRLFKLKGKTVMLRDISDILSMSYQGIRLVYFSLEQIVIIYINALQK